MSKAQVNGGSLLIEGQASVWNALITVNGVVMTTSDAAGRFTISRSGYTPPADCTVDVSDGLLRPTTVHTPTGVLRDPAPQLTYAEIVGTPTAAGISTVTFRATDVNGLTATGTYTVRVTPAVPLSITPEPWPTAVDGQFTNLWIDGAGGLRPYRWSVVGGALPPGMTLVQDAVSGPRSGWGGTPRTPGTYDWALRLTDAQGAAVTRWFTATVAPAPQAAPAPAGGTAVFLSSSSPGVASVPATVTVPEGATNASFPVSTTAVSATTVVTIDATYAGTLTARLSVTAH